MPPQPQQMPGSAAATTTTTNGGPRVSFNRDVHVKRIGQCVVLRNITSNLAHNLNRCCSKELNLKLSTIRNNKKETQQTHIQSISQLKHLTVQCLPAK